MDGHLRTSDPDVYAIGDVAAFPLKRYGNVTRQVGARIVGAPSRLQVLAVQAQVRGKIIISARPTSYT